MSAMNVDDGIFRLFDAFHFLLTWPSTLPNHIPNNPAGKNFLHRIFAVTDMMLSVAIHNSGFRVHETALRRGKKCPACHKDAG